MKNRGQQAEEDEILQTFRRVWAGAAEIASAEIKDAPDVRGVLVDGRRFGMEIVTLTDGVRAQHEDLLRGSFERELEAACAERGINASFGLGVEDWHADKLLDRSHRTRVIAMLVQLAKEAGDQSLDLDEDALEARGIEDLSSVAIVPDPEGFALYFARSGWFLPGSDFVRERIARKDEHAAQYRAAIGDADLWLLLVAGRTLPASVTRPGTAEIFETRFDRVFFMECWVDMEKVIELAVRRLSPAPMPE